MFVLLDLRWKTMNGPGGYVPPGYVSAPQFDPEDSDPLPSSTQGPLGSEHHFPQQVPHIWSSGICACCDDMNSCCLGFWCPCVLFGRNVEVLEGRPWTGPCLMHFLLWGVITGICCASTHGTTLGLLGSCVPFYACGYRKMLRAKYNLEVAPCGDFLTHLCCHQCALCQEYREICDRSTALGFPVVAPPNQNMEGHPMLTSNGMPAK